MHLRVIRATSLRDQPTPDGTVLLQLKAGTVLIQRAVSDAWIEVEVKDANATGWVLRRDCAEIDMDMPSPGKKSGDTTRKFRPPPIRKVDIKELAAQRQRSLATPVCLLPASHKGQSDNVDIGLPWLFPGQQIQYQQQQRQQEPERQKTQQELWYEHERLMKQYQERTAAEAAKIVAADTVDISVFGPQAVQAGSDFLVQVFLHTLDQTAEIAQQAKETDAASGRRAVKTLATEIARGTQVQVIFEGRGLLADDTMQQLTWRGEPDTCQFIVGAPADAAGKTFYPRILVLVNSVPVGSVAFALPATARDAPAETVIHGDDARRYRYAFLSYSSTDRAEVLKRAQGLKAGKIDFFQDILSLEPGEKWAPKLYEEIDRCDLFLLFWSSHAKTSPWVTKEVEYALARQKSSSGVPDITPVIIEGPPPPSPPDALKDIHFNDSLMYVLAAVEAQAQSPKPS